MLKIVLISLAVIGTIGGGVAIAKHNGSCSSERHIEKVTERVTDKLDLDANQQQQLTAFATQIITLKSQHQAQRGEIKAQALALLETEQMDREQAIHLIDSKVETVHQHKQTLVNGFADFSDSLSPAQREKLAAMIDDATSHRWGPRRWIQ